MAELVDEHDDRQDEQERQQDGKKAPDPAQSLTDEIPSPAASCDRFSNDNSACSPLMRAAGRRPLSPASSAPTVGPPRRWPARRSSPCVAPRSPRLRHLQRLSYKLGDLKEPEPSRQECLHRNLVGRIEHGGRHAALLHGLARQRRAP